MERCCTRVEAVQGDSCISFTDPEVGGLYQVEMEISIFSIQMEREFVGSPLESFEDLLDGWIGNICCGNPQMVSCCVGKSLIRTSAELLIQQFGVGALCLGMDVCFCYPLMANYGKELPIHLVGIPWIELKQILWNRLWRLEQVTVGGCLELKDILIISHLLRSYRELVME